MDCTDCVEQLYAFLDRELGPAEIAAVNTHLDHCGHCKDDFVVEERFLKHVHDSCTEDRAPVELRERIVLKLRQESN
ncbi:MAG TPA: mycothiol system anti-sigma-R factor [Candidatus Saccharimonadales bacterium]|nr:mycothiol system anti-sigma-R factor [Candidatus Saccharimonadales bacterium]